MELDAKHSILYAIYTEYQKDIPNMSVITPDTLCLDKQVFNIAILKLENEGYIKDVVVSKELGQVYPREVLLFRTMMTKTGIDYVEQVLTMSPVFTGQERVQLLIKKFREYGWDTLSTLAAKVLVEIGMNAMK